MLEKGYFCEYFPNVFNFFAIPFMGFLLKNVDKVFNLGL